MTRPCPHCQNAAEPFLQAGDLNQKVGGAVFEYFRCPHCGVVYLDPIPPDLSRYYQSDYPPYRISAEQLPAMSEAARWRVDFVKRFVAKGRVLEIGPSYGGFAYQATQAGFEVDVIEMDRECCDFIGRNIPGVTAINTGDVVEGLARLQRKYECIALWHNIEHLPDPWTVVDRLAQALKPGGVLVISTPNPDSYQFRIFGKHWLHLDAPRHLVLIPPAVLSRFVGQRGLEQMHFTTTDPDSLAISRSGWDESRHHVLRGHSWLSRLVMKRLYRILAGIVRPFERRNQRGGAYTAVYRAKS